MTIHAFTELHSNFPAYINLTEQPDGAIKFSIRTRGNDGKDYATIALTALQAEELADSIYKHNYKDECEIDRPAALAPPPLPATDATGRDMAARFAASVRKAALEEAANTCEAWGNEKVLKWQDTPDMLEDAKARAWDSIVCANAIRALISKETGK